MRPDYIQRGGELITARRPFFMPITRRGQAFGPLPPVHPCGLSHPAYFLNPKFLILNSAQLCTSVPISSPSITRRRLPGTSMLNTYIGRLFSLHMVVAVRSITFSPRV